MNKTIPEPIRLKIAHARVVDGKLRDHVAKMYGVGTATVSRITSDFLNNKSISVKQRGGARHFKDYSREIKKTKLLIEKQPELTQRQIAVVWEQEYEVSLSPERIGKLMQENGLETDSRKRVNGQKISQGKKNPRINRYICELGKTGKLIEEEPGLILDQIAKIWETRFKVPLSPQRIGQLMKEYGLETDSRKRVKEMERLQTKKNSEDDSSARFMSRQVQRSMERELKKKRSKMNPKIVLRMDNLLAMNNGCSPAYLAKKFKNVSVSNLYRLKRLFLEGGYERIKQLDYGKSKGRCKLSPEQKDKLWARLRRKPSTTLRQTRDWIWKKFGVSYSISGVRGLIRSFGLLHKKAREKLRAPDLEVQKKWADKHDARVAREKHRSVFIYLDGVHPRHKVDPGGCWVLENEIPVIPQTTARDGMNILGALNTRTGKLNYLVRKRLNGEVLIEMLELLKQEYPNVSRIYVILDNARYHKSKQVREWLKSQPRTKTAENGKQVKCPRILPYFLPSYCPHFNKIERLWKELRKEVTKNRVHGNLKKFKAAVLKFLDGVEAKWEKKYSTYVDARFRFINPADGKDVSIAC